MSTEQETTLNEQRLDSTEIRILGSLIEKQATSPETYPLTLNALVAAHAVLGQLGEEVGERVAPDLAQAPRRELQPALALLDQRSDDDPLLRCALLVGTGDAQRQSGDPSFRDTLLAAFEDFFELLQLVGAGLVGSGQR